MSRAGYVADRWRIHGSPRDRRVTIDKRVLVYFYSPFATIFRHEPKRRVTLHSHHKHATTQDILIDERTALMWCCRSWMRPVMTASFTAATHLQHSSNTFAGQLATHLYHSWQLLLEAHLHISADRATFQSSALQSSLPRQPFDDFSITFYTSAIAVSVSPLFWPRPIFIFKISHVPPCRRVAQTL